MTKKVNRSAINILQHMLNRMNLRIDLENEIETWNHCCAGDDETIEIEEEDI